MYCFGQVAAPRTAVKDMWAIEILKQTGQKALHFLPLWFGLAVWWIRGGFPCTLCKMEFKSQATNAAPTNGWLKPKNTPKNPTLGIELANRSIEARSFLGRGGSDRASPPKKKAAGGACHGRDVVWSPIFSHNRGCCLVLASSPSVLVIPSKLWL